MNSIIVALISGLSVAIPSIIGSIVANNSSKKLINYRLDKLETHVIKHNNLIDRMYKIENRVTLLEEKERWIKWKY